MTAKVEHCERWPSAVLLLLIACRCAEHEVHNIEPEQVADLSDRNADAVPLLSQLPNVVDVERHGPNLADSPDHSPCRLALRSKETMTPLICDLSQPS